MRALWGCALLLVTSPAQAFEWWSPFVSRSDAALEQAREARQRGNHDLASSLLVEAEAAGAGRAVLLRERGLLSRDRGQLAEAVDQLADAAELDPSSTARVDQAGVLVTLGRWPEAVEALAAAIEERGARLRADDVVQDPRFAALVSFAPFTQLIQVARDQQAGPLGRLLRKLDRVEGSVQTAQEILGVLWRWMGVLSRLFELLGVSVLALLALGILMGAGVNQLGLLSPPWPIAIGMVAASGVWHVGARIATADASGGFATIGAALGIVAAPYALVAGLRAWRRRRRFDALAPGHLAHTAVLADELARLARAAESHPESRAELERVAAALARRLGGQDDGTPGAP